MRDAWVELAQLNHNSQNWKDCYAAATSAIGIQNRGYEYMVDPTAWGERPHDLASIAAWNLGLKTEAILHAEKASELAPKDARIQKNLSVMRGESA